MDVLQKVSNPDYMERLIEFYRSNNIPITLKRCGEIVKAGNGNYPYRNGRFSIIKDEHDELVRHGGAYLFLVEDDTGVVKAKLIKAEHIGYKPQITWTRLIDEV